MLKYTAQSKILNYFRSHFSVPMGPPSLSDVTRSPVQVKRKPMVMMVDKGAVNKIFRKTRIMQRFTGKITDALF